VLFDVVATEFDGKANMLFDDVDVELIFQHEMFASIQINALLFVPGGKTPNSCVINCSFKNQKVLQPAIRVRLFALCAG
jgi:hypothetical protein